MLRFDQTCQVYLNDLKNCTVCPRACMANRLAGERGYCNSGAGFYVSSVCIHRGEEPPVSGKYGICNIFFTNCNLQCTYCQNHQISLNTIDHSPDSITLENLIGQITSILNTGINSVGFVSPTHFIPQVKVIVHVLRNLGYRPVFVYNSNGYDSVNELKKLEGFIDVYLPDFKYTDSMLSDEYSGAEDYPQVALNAIMEMYRQVGGELVIDPNGYAQKGLIIRHLVLPGAVSNSLEVLRTIATKISPEISVSLMSQYYPNYKVASHQHLGRTLHQMEYNKVVEEMEKLGMENGWIQDLDSYDNYRPDFCKKNHPFE